MVISSLFASFSASSFSLLWMFCVLLIPLSWLNRQLPHVNDLIAWFLVLASFILVIACHAILNAKVSNFPSALALVGFAACVLIWLFPGPAFLGGSTLRFLRLGGGIPIELSLKSAASKPVSGCLILSSSAEVLIIPQALGKSCPLIPKYFWKSSDIVRSGVENIERSDVLRTVPAQASDRDISLNNPPSKVN